MARDLSAREAKELIGSRRDDPDFVVMDVRTPEEFSDDSIKGHILLDIAAPEFMDWLEGLEGLDRDKTYLVYCRSGNRSAAAARIMEGLGFRKVYNLGHGIIGWKREGFKPG